MAQLNGIFALAVWDGRSQMFLLARDHMGIKPLYYFDDGRTFAFGSELTAVVAAMESKPDLRPEAVAEFFAFGYLSGSLTPLRNYFKLPPGHLMRYDAGRRSLQVRPYWNAMEFLTAPEFTEDEHTLADRLEALLRDSIRRQLVSDVPLGAFLSGGIDSTLVVALMTQVASVKPKTYTIGFTVPQWDEAPWAKKIAAHLGTEHQEQYISPQGLEEAILDVAKIYDEPFGDTSAIPTTLLCRMTRRHVTVALSGDGGDELFFGYDRYRRSVQYQSWQRLPRPIRWAGLRLLEGFPAGRVRHWAEVLKAPSLAACYAVQNQWPGWQRLFPSAGNFQWQRDRPADRRNPRPLALAETHARRGPDDVPARGHPGQGRPRQHECGPGGSGPDPRLPAGRVRRARAAAHEIPPRRDEVPDPQSAGPARAAADMGSPQERVLPFRWPTGSARNFGHGSATN